MIIERLLVHEGMSARGAVVVAHPDDEALFFAGLMLQWPITWDVICCSIPKTDPVRAWKFLRACEILNAAPKLIPWTEAPIGHPVPDPVLAVLEEELPAYDVIVTHSRVGEYGHSQHVHLHDFIGDRWPTKAMFGCYGTLEGPLVCRLDENQSNRKWHAIGAYDHVAPNNGGAIKAAFLHQTIGKMFDLRVESYEGPE